MNVAKRVSLLMVSGVAVVSLSGCDAVRGTFDFLGGSEADSGATEASAPAAAATPMVPAIPAGPAPLLGGAPSQPAPFDLGVPAPTALPASTLNVQTSPANAALIGATTGTSPSGFGALTPGMPAATPSPAYYGAQPNPYQPRIPGTTNPLPNPAAPSLSYGLQPTVPGASIPAPAPMTVSPATPAITAAVPAQPGTINPENLSESTLVAIQTALKSRGLYSDVLDGIWGSKSKESMKAYLATRGESAVTLDTLFSLGVSL